jgi:hypothetical protein
MPMRHDKPREKGVDCVNCSKHETYAGQHVTKSDKHTFSVRICEYRACCCGRLQRGKEQNRLLSSRQLARLPTFVSFLRSTGTVI